MKKLIYFLIILLSFNIFNVSSDYYYDDYKKYEKVIRVNTFSEKLSYYEYGEKIGEFSISSGDKKNRTPAGRFKIMNKNEMMWSKSANKWMPYWLEFYNGEYGIHGLPLNTNFEKEKSEEEVLGLEDAGGCVRLAEEDIKKLYEWADYSTVVLIAYDLNEYSLLEEGKNIINSYFDHINKKEYEEAFNLKKYKRYSYQTFLNIYNDIEIRNIEINNFTGSKFQTKVDLYKGGKLIKSGVKSIFYTGGGLIVNSFVVK